jgi:hypothetical protein
MTTSRSSSATVALLTALLGSAAVEAQPHVEQGSWQAVGSGFGFVANGETHAVVFMTCDLGRGWISVIQNEPRRTDRSMVLRIGTSEVRPLTRSGDDGLMGDYTEAMVPQDHPVFRSVASSGLVWINGVTYPIRPGAERRAITSFLASCATQ